MLEEFKTIGVQFEMVVCENGSTDNTPRLAEQLRRTHPQVRVEHLPTPNYGLALKHGISVCRGDVVMIFNIDFWSIEFVRTAIAKLEDYDMVIGSKTMEGARDQRPILRRVITWGFNFFLRKFFGFRGTDTHGMKAFRRRSLAEILDKCITDEFIFDSEFVLRAERKGLWITEVPVHVRELRQPSYWSLLRRIPGTFLNLARLSHALRFPSR
jgi:glycosyltransferase involved in cell wall biosynthesis